MTILVSETRGAVMYSSPMTVGVTSFGFPEANMACDRYEMSRSVDGILTFFNPFTVCSVVTSFVWSTQKCFNDWTRSDNQGTSCVAVDFLCLSCSLWNEPAQNHCVASTEDAEMGTVSKALVQ